MCKGEVAQLVDHREELGALRVVAIDENQRSVLVRKHETPELLDIEPSMRVITDDAIDGHRDALVLHCLPKNPYCFLWVLGLCSPVLIQIEKSMHCICNRQGVRHVHGLTLPRPDECNRLPFDIDEVVPYPVLSALLDLDRVIEVRARVNYSRPVGRPEISYSHSMVRDGRRVQVKQIDMDHVCEIHLLLQCRCLRLVEPLRITGARRSCQ